MSAPGIADRDERQRLLTALLDDFARRSRPVYVRYKRTHGIHRAIDLALRWITLGGQRTYLTEYVTTLGHTIWVPDGFEHREPGSAYETLRHEAIHVAQFERYGWVGMVLVYLLLPLPLGLSYGRARLEMEAYAETLRATAELDGIDAARSERLREFIVARFVGPDYGWMWPFPGAVRRWIASALDCIERDIRAGTPYDSGSTPRSP